MAEPKAKPAKAAAAEAPAKPISNLPRIPKPGKPSPEEVAFREKLDQILAPVANASVSEDDAAKIKDAIRAIAAKNPMRQTRSSPRFRMWRGRSSCSGTAQDRVRDAQRVYRVFSRPIRLGRALDDDAARRRSALQQRRVGLGDHGVLQGTGAAVGAGHGGVGIGPSRCRAEKPKPRRSPPKPGAKKCFPPISSRRSLRAFPRS